MGWGVETGVWGAGETGVGERLGGGEAKVEWVEYHLKWEGT